METESHEEVMIKAIKELKKSPVISVISSEWSMENRLLCYREKVYVLKMDLHQKIIALCHDSKIAGHPGRWKTLELVSWNYWWPQMSKYIGKYVSTCDMCLHTKTIKQPLTGELHLLPIPDTPWDTISVDFITELLESNGQDSIMVVVDSVTKRSHFMSTVTTILSIGQPNFTSNMYGSTMDCPRELSQTEGCNSKQSLLGKSTDC